MSNARSRGISAVLLNLLRQVGRKERWPLMYEGRTVYGDVRNLANPLGVSMDIVGKKSQGMSVTCLEKDKVVILAFNDRSLNFYVTDALKENLKELISSKIDEGYQHFLLNMENVKIIDSCGVGLVIAANNLTAAKSAKLYLTNIKPFIIKIFDIMRISKHLNVFETEDVALQSIQNAS